jgi:hypothetical protein
MVNGPAFFASQSANQNITLATSTKANIDTIIFDTDNNFNTSTNRFTPTVAGYYQVSGGTRSQAVTTNTGVSIYIYKNGSQYVTTVEDGSATTKYPSLSTLVYLNGSTDYVELYVQITGSGTASIVGSLDRTWFSGAMVRGA